MDLNKLEVAKENLELAQKIDPNNAQVHNAFAFLYEKLNDHDKANEQYEKALDLTPNDWGVQNNFGRFLCDRGEYEQGMALLTRAISTQLNDRQWLALTNAARRQLAMKQTQQAKAYFKQALILNATYPPALLEMQKISYQSGDYWAAKGYLHRYLSVADHRSGTLWFDMQTERALGSAEVAKEYQNLLLVRRLLQHRQRPRLLAILLRHMFLRVAGLGPVVLWVNAFLVPSVIRPGATAAAPWPAWGGDPRAG